MFTPTSTYRLQISADFTLDDAVPVLPYLAELGVGAVYCSPLLTSTSGSTHGYDATDPTRVDPQRGGEDGWRRFVAAARAAGLQIVVDIVPNHLGVDSPAENPSWWSVLREGRSSVYADWYDIDWSRPITLPVLGDDAAVDDLEVVDGPDGEPELRYFDHRFPLAPGSAEGPIAAVLERQAYRLMPWRTGDTDLSYRRFFTITSLAGVRIEDDAVFDATHERILRWIREDGVEGLRIDHPDGLVDPAGYFDRLRAAAPDTWIVVEKILEPGEAWPTGWPVAGTTGYDAATEVGQLFVDPAAETELTELYAELTGDDLSVEQQMEIGKDRAVQQLFIAEVRRITGVLGAEAPAAEVEDAVRAIAAVFDVYRSYLPLGVEHLDAAIAHARASRPDLDATLTEVGALLHDPDHEGARRFQQLTGPVLAKGLEDTAWYRTNRFAALNEVGGDPTRFGRPVAQIHTALTERQRVLPASMTALSTHDTKRSEDVRARLSVLSEIPQAWAGFVRVLLDDDAIPDRSLAYLLAQTWVGIAGPGADLTDRLQAYAEKAMREAAVHTGWADTDTAFEDRVHAMVDRWLADPSVTSQLERLLAVVQPAGWSNALAQKLVQLTMPGAPDVYQGTELWDASLVDPDNRRPVDFAARRSLLARLDQAPPLDATGEAKLWLVRQTLRLRRDHPDRFGTYAPALADGPAADHLFGFDRGGVITAVTRLPLRLAEAGGWRDTTVTLPAGTWTDGLNRRGHIGLVAVSTLFADYPVALLVRD